MLDLILNIIVVLIVYHCFNIGSFKSALLVKLIYQCVLLWYGGTFTEILSLGAIVMIIYIGILLVVNIILTAIEQWAYNKTNSFFTYFILATVVEYLFSLVIGAIVVFLIP